MALLSLNNVTFGFTGPILMDSISLQVEPGERIGLLGRNGTGKSTLLRILHGELEPDSGEIVRNPGLEIAGLQQDVPLDPTGTVQEFLQEKCEMSKATETWEVHTRIDRTIAQLDLDASAVVRSLSAGSKRRVLLAAALVAEPDLLILDEPTNHLDIDTIGRLEETLKRRSGALAFVTHDRSFLRRLATRILDLDRGELRSYSCGYERYLERKEDEQRARAEQAAQFDKKLAQEEVWIRQGIRARRTRNEGRVRALEALREERRQRRDAVGKVKAELNVTNRSGRMVLRTKNVSFAYETEPIVRDVSLTIMRGDRIGILGPNGCGKTTLLKLLLDELTPNTGTVERGVKVEHAHFEQLHDVLDEEKSLFDNVGQGRDVVTFGSGNRHVMGYLEDFLFTREQIRGPVSKLSGGEKKRLQLAIVLSRPTNLLVLDEPTNDLDLETLELLESMLLEFDGTLLLVSHDREFIDNVVTSTLVSEGAGRWKEYVGGYKDWLRQQIPKESGTKKKKSASKSESKRAKTANKPPRLSFKEKRELELLPDRIEALETEQKSIFTAMSLPEFYKSASEEITRTQDRLAELERELASAYERWEQLESIREASE